MNNLLRKLGIGKKGLEESVKPKKKVPTLQEVTDLAYEKVYRVGPLIRDMYNKGMGTNYSEKDFRSILLSYVLKNAVMGLDENFSEREKNKQDNLYHYLHSGDENKIRGFFDGFVNPSTGLLAGLSLRDGFWGQYDGAHKAGVKYRELLKKRDGLYWLFIKDQVNDFSDLITDRFTIKEN